MAKKSSILNNLNELPFLRTTRLVTVDIGESLLKLVEVDFKGDKPKICNFILTALPPTLQNMKDKKAHQENMVAFLKDTLQKNKFQAKEASVLISGGSVFSRKIRIPKLSSKELENGIKWEASNQIPFSLESSHFDWQFLREIELPDGTKNQEYMIAASGKKTVDDLVDLVTELGFKPCCIGIPIIALYNLVLASPQFDTKERIAVIDIGARRSNIVIIEQKHILFSREIPIGDDNINEAIFNEFTAEQWNLDSVEKAKKDKDIYALLLHGDQNIDDVTKKRIVSVIRPLLEKLFNEIRRSFDYFKEHFEKNQVEKIILSGKGSLSQGFDEIVKKLFNVPVEFINIEQVFTIKSNVNRETLDEHMQDLAIVLGLALGKERQINFGPSEFKVRKAKISQLVLTSVLGISVLSVLLLLIMQVNVGIGTLRKEIGSSNKQMQNIIPQIQSFNEKSELYKQDKEYMDGLRVRQLLLANALKELANIVPRAITFISIELVNEGWLNVNGYVFDDALAEMSSESVLTEFIIAIENSAFFTKVKLVASERGGIFEVEHSLFNINCRIISRKEIKEI